MTQKYKEPEVCEACGVAGEMGFIITEGNETSEISLFASSKEIVETEFKKYLLLAQQVNSAVKHQITLVEGEQFELQAKFQFEVSAEKLIFDLKSRSLAR